MNIAHIEPQHIALGLDERGQTWLRPAAIAVNSFFDVGSRFTSQGEFDFHDTVFHRLDEWFRGFEDGTLADKIGSSVRNAFWCALEQFDTSEFLDGFFDEFTLRQIEQDRERVVLRS